MLFRSVSQSRYKLGELTLGSNTYLQTYSEALSAAIWTELPCIYAGVIGAKNGATWTGIIDYKVVYHLRFSEYNIPSLEYDPAIVKAKEMREDISEDDVEWVPKKIVKKTREPSNSSRLPK